MGGYFCSYGIFRSLVVPNSLRYFEEHCMLFMLLVRVVPLWPWLSTILEHAVIYIAMFLAVDIFIYFYLLLLYNTTHSSTYSKRLT